MPKMLADVCFFFLSFLFFSRQIVVAQIRTEIGRGSKGIQIQLPQWVCESVHTRLSADFLYTITISWGNFGRFPRTQSLPWTFLYLDGRTKFKYVHSIYSKVIDSITPWLVAPPVNRTFCLHYYYILGKFWALP